MPPDALDTLREINRNLRSTLVRFRPEHKRCSSITPNDFSALLAELLRAAECLRLQPTHSESAAALATETQEYRRNLEALQQFLPGLHARLQAEKSRLEAARAQVAAAISWASADKRTL